MFIFLSVACGVNTDVNKKCDRETSLVRDVLRNSHADY
jgi:hypothetical protein